jgi:hypothetical protein
VRVRVEVEDVGRRLWHVRLLLLLSPTTVNPPAVRLLLPRHLRCDSLSKGGLRLEPLQVLLLRWLVLLLLLLIVRLGGLLLLGLVRGGEVLILLVCLLGGVGSLDLRVPRRGALEDGRLCPCEGIVGPVGGHSRDEDEEG